MYISKLIAALILAITYNLCSAQNFKGQVKKLALETETAYKNKKLTPIEYQKLREEHQTILYAIEKAEADDYVSSDEKNKIHAKITRSKKRFAKYKVNREVY